VTGSEPAERRAPQTGLRPPTHLVDEVLVSASGSTIGMTREGSVYIAEPGEPALSLPTGIRGDVVRARRSALLLFDAAGELDSP
jgi:hypothetical protein